jgi:hypothetical protein
VRKDEGGNEVGRPKGADVGNGKLLPLIGGGPSPPSLPLLPPPPPPPPLGFPFIPPLLSVENGLPLSPIWSLVIRYHERKVDYRISAPDLQGEKGYASVKKGRDERNETWPTSRYRRGEREEKIEISREAAQKKLRIETPDAKPRWGSCMHELPSTRRCVGNKLKSEQFEILDL